jgi:TolA-binding protein
VQLALRAIGMVALWVAFVGVAVVPVDSALAAPALTKADLDGQKELLQFKFDALKEAQQKDIENLRQRLDYVDKRVDDQNTYAGQGVDRLGIWVTVLLAVLGLIGFVTVNRRTKAEAQEAAKAWFLENSEELKSRVADLQKKIGDLERHADFAEKKITAEVQEIQGQAGQAKVNIADEEARAIERLQKNMGKTQNSEEPLSDEKKQDAELLKERSDRLKRKPESEYLFADWNARAFSAYSNNHFEGAAYFWLKAAEAADAKSKDAAQALLFRGIVQGKLWQNEAAVATYEEVDKRYGQAPEAALRELVAKALFCKGVLQVLLGQNKAAIATYEEVDKRYGQVPEAALREQVAQALVNKGITQGKLGQNEAAIATYEEVDKRYGQVPEAALREQVAQALVNKGITQGKLWQNEAAVATYEEVDKRYGQAPEAALRELVATALFSKGVTQGQLGQNEAAIATYEEVDKRYGQAPEAALRELVATALFSKGVTQGQLGQNEAAIAIYEEVDKRYGHAPEAALRERVAWALVNKGVRQGQLGQNEAKIAAYEEVDKGYGQAPEAVLREQVAFAHNGLGFAWICEAKRLWMLDAEKAKDLMLKAASVLNRAVKVLDKNGMVMGNLAYLACLQGDVQAADSWFKQALQAPDHGGEEIYRDILKDLEIYPVSEDENMRALVERLWQAHKSKA